MIDMDRDGHSRPGVDTDQANHRAEIDDAVDAYA